MKQLFFLEFSNAEQCSRVCNTTHNCRYVLNVGKSSYIVAFKNCNARAAKKYNINNLALLCFTLLYLPQGTGLGPILFLAL